MKEENNRLDNGLEIHNIINNLLCVIFATVKWFLRTTEQKNKIL